MVDFKKCDLTTFRGFLHPLNITLTKISFLTKLKCLKIFIIKFFRLSNLIDSEYRLFTSYRTFIP
nr:MAG TPA: hypothetical protein [Caudoviricetes sp.]